LLSKFAPQVDMGGWIMASWTVAPTGRADDASQLCPAGVATHLTIRDDLRAGVVDRIRAALTEARGAKRPFIASTARHSMGGQSLAMDGTVATRCGAPRRAAAWGGGRWSFARKFAWLNQFRRLRVCYDKRPDIREAFLSLGCALICWQWLGQTWRPA
jgi:hypothetical protein